MRNIFDHYQISSAICVWNTFVRHPINYSYISIIWKISEYFICGQIAIESLCGVLCWIQSEIVDVYQILLIFSSQEWDAYIANLTYFDVRCALYELDCLLLNICMRVYDIHICTHGCLVLGRLHSITFYRTVFRGCSNVKWHCSIHFANITITVLVNMMFTTITGIFIYGSTFWTMDLSFFGLVFWFSNRSPPPAYMLEYWI